MTELPALREALRETAERRVRRRRSRRVRRMVAPLVVAACALAVVLAVPDSRPTPGEEVTRTPTPTATPSASATPDTQQLAETYSVFRRPARAADRLPKAFRRGGRPGMEIDWSQARRLATSGPLAAYAYPATFNGTLQLCTFLQSGAHTGGGGCGPFDPDDARPKWGKVFMGSKGPAYMLLLPDGVDRVEIELSGGRTVTKAVDENGIVYQGHGVHRFTWTDSGGVVHTTRAGI